MKLRNRGVKIVLLRGERELHRVTYQTAGGGEIVRLNAAEDTVRTAARLVVGRGAIARRRRSSLSGTDRVILWLPG